MTHAYTKFRSEVLYNRPADERVTALTLHGRPDIASVSGVVYFEDAFEL